MNLNQYEFDRMKRHFKVFNIFGFKIYIWLTTPNRIVKHLKELIHEIRILNYEKRTGNKFKGSRDV